MFARPTQPTIPVRPDNQRLETVTELRRETETETKIQQQFSKFTYVSRELTFVITVIVFSKSFDGINSSDQGPFVDLAKSSAIPTPYITSRSAC